MDMRPFEPIPECVRWAIRRIHSHTRTFVWQQFVTAYGPSRAAMEYRRSFHGRDASRFNDEARATIRRAKEIAADSGWEWSEIVRTVMADFAEGGAQ